MPALISIAEWCAKGNRLPFDLLLPGTVGDPFPLIWDASYFDFENLALFNRAAYLDVSARNAKSEAMLEECRKIQKIPVEDDEDQYEFRNRQLARRMQSIEINGSEMEGVRSYADQVTVIATWAFIEKILNRSLVTLRSYLGMTELTDHRWPRIVDAYQECGIALSAVKQFEDINECRLVNNSIKHGGFVSSSLAACPTFDGQVGKDLNDCVLDTQRYYFSAADYIMRTLEGCSAVFTAHAD